LAALAIALAVCTVPDISAGQDFPSANEAEEALIRAELQRIMAENPDQAAEARMALEALNQPDTTQAGRQARNRRERGARRIVNGLPARGHSAVGALLQGNDPRTAKAWCTGTLVGCDKFLTAAHCIVDDVAPQSYVVFFQELGFFQVKDIRWPKDDYKHPNPYFDLAMLTLARPVEDIAPMPINFSVKPLNKSMATIIGFGRTGGSREDYGIKREGSARTSACPASYADQNLLCWAYDADVKSLRRASNTCNGDSGGGVFMRDNEGGKIMQKVFGVVSGGKDDNCVKNDVSYNVDVYAFRPWIEAAGEGRLSASMCGRPISDGRQIESKKLLTKITKDRPEAVTWLDVPPGTGAVRVALNGEDDGSGKNDFDLLVYRGERIPGAAPVCKEDGPGQFAFCEIKAPASGRWTIVATRKKGEGDVQISATLAARRDP
jgi:V8-like Glu-specific endopeptidase